MEPSFTLQRSGVVWLRETLVTGKGRFPLCSRRLKGSRGLQWERDWTNISAEDAWVPSGLHIVTPFLGSLWTCSVAFFSTLIRGLSWIPMPYFEIVCPYTNPGTWGRYRRIPFDLLNGSMHFLQRYSFLIMLVLPKHQYNLLHVWTFGVTEIHRLVPCQPPPTPRHGHTWLSAWQYMFPWNGEGRGRRVVCRK